MECFVNFDTGTARKNFSRLVKDVDHVGIVDDLAVELAHQF